MRCTNFSGPPWPRRQEARRRPGGTLARPHAGTCGGRASAVLAPERVRPRSPTPRERRRPLRRRHPDGDAARARRGHATADGRERGDRARRTHRRDGGSDREWSGGGAHAEGPTTGQPLSRRELREQRERAQAAEKATTKTTRPPRSTRAKWIRRGIAIAVVLAADPGRGVVRRLPATARQRHALGAHGRVDPRQRRQRHREHHRTLVVHEQPAADRRQAERDQGAGHRHRHHDQDRHRAPDLSADPAPRAADRSRRHARPRGGAERGRVAADRAPGVGAACRLHDVRAARRGAHLVLHGPDVARHQVAARQLRRRHRATRRRAEPVGLADPANRSATSRSPRSTRASRWTPPTAAPTSTARRSCRCATASASLVIKQDGSANVGVWGRDFTMSPDIKAVRQNLVLIVDNGQLNPALQENDTTVFGATLGNNVFVWRSGVGVTADGALVYAGRSGDVDRRPGPHAAGGGRGAGDGDGHQHRLGERVHLRAAGPQHVQLADRRRASCSTA